MAISAQLSIPADSRWNHALLATVLSAAQSADFDLEGLAEISLAVHELLKDVQEVAGVEAMQVEVTAGSKALRVSLTGLGEDIDLASAYPASLALRRATGFQSDPGAITYRLAFGQPGPNDPQTG